MNRKAVILLTVLAVSVLSGIFAAGCAGLGSRAEETTRVQGDTISLGELTLTVESEEFRDTVEPENPEGYFDYYEEHEGYRYYVMSGRAENTSAEEISSNAFCAEGETDAGEEDARLLFLDQENTRFPDVIGAGREERFLLIMLVKDGAQPEEFRIFYNEGYRTPEEGETCDYGVIKETGINGE